MSSPPPLGLVHRDSLLVVMTAFDIEGYKSQSIGALMFERVAKDCIERGDRILDFTIGDEPYKQQFGGQPTPISSVTQAGSAAGAMALFALKQAPWIKQAAKRVTDLGPIRTSTGTRQTLVSIELKRGSGFCCWRRFSSSNYRSAPRTRMTHPGWIRSTRCVIMRRRKCSLRRMLQRASVFEVRAWRKRASCSECRSAASLSRSA